MTADAAPRAIFITHHHSDHNADLGNLLVLAWATGLAKKGDVYGPPRINALIDLALQYHSYDIAIRIPDEGRVDPRTLFARHEFAGPGEIYRDKRVVARRPSSTIRRWCRRTHSNSERRTAPSSFRATRPTART